MKTLKVNEEQIIVEGVETTLDKKTNETVYKVYFSAEEEKELDSGKKIKRMQSFEAKSFFKIKDGEVLEPKSIVIAEWPIEGKTYYHFKERLTQSTPKK